ncbi:MAG: DUF1476 domain-containing protein [Acetobacteraceae bacterium]
MTTFQDRERAFEAKYAHDEQFRFLVTARRDKLFARWAAEQLDPADEADLTAQVLAVRDGAGHDERVLDLMQAVWRARGGDRRTPEFKTALNQCAAQAREQLLDPKRPWS